MKLILPFLLIPALLFAQEAKPQIYNPAADAKKEIAEAVEKAGKEGKHVFIQIGGNWCTWCLRFHKFTTGDTQIDSAFTAGYIRIRVNYSEENKNLEILKDLRYPQRFGFPVFVILDGKGNYLHTQNSAYLEEGKGYSKKNILDFLRSWSPGALNPDEYKD